METRVDEIADRIYRLSTFVPLPGVPQGFTFNQFLVDAEQPLLFHTGQRSLFPSVSAAASRVMDLGRLRFVTFSHVEADESGSVNQWLAAAPNAVAAHGRIGCGIWLTDAADRPPRALDDGEWIDLGGKEIQRIDTPHVPHSWDAGLMYEKTTGTLFCSDLFTHLGDPPALTEGDIVGPSIAAEDTFHFTSLTPDTGRAMRRLAALKPKRLAVMHGSSYAGEAAPALEALADYYDGLLRKAIAS